MNVWTANELDRIAGSDELLISVQGSNGKLRKPKIIWVVRVGDHLYVRSAHGLEGAWYRAAIRSGLGHISSGGVDKDVRLEHVAGYEDDAIDAAFQSKYHRYPSQYVEPVTNEQSHSTTIRLVPR